MNKKKWLFIILGVMLVMAALVYQYVNKSTEDFSNTKPKEDFSFATLIEKTNQDTASLGTLKDQIIGVSGAIKKISKDQHSMTLELGDSVQTSSIICQMDARYLEEFSSLTEGQSINLKGKMTGFTIDTDLGLGNTIELNYCTLNKK